MEKCEKVTYSVVIVRLDMKMRSKSTLINFRVQGYLVTMAKDHFSVVYQHLQRTSPQKLLGQLHSKFHMLPPGNREKRVYIFDPGYKTKLAAVLMYGKKTLKIFFSITTDQCLETWYVAF